MNAKISAIMMASIMVLVGFAAFFAPSDAADPTGTGTTYDDPVVLVGDCSTTDHVPYVLSDATLTVKADMNPSAFDNPTFTYAYYYNENTWPNPAETNATATDAPVAATGVAVATTTTTGSDDITFTKASLNGDGYYLIQVTVEDDLGTLFGDVTLYFNYGAYIDVANTAPAVILNSTDTVTVTADSTTIISPSTAIEIQRGAEYNAYPFVQVGDSSNISYKEADGYDFYASGLPTGIAMTANAVISGKLSYTSALGDTGSFTVYAVSLTGGTIYSQTYNYKVIGDKNAFEYDLGANGTKKVYSETDYASILNTGDITVKLYDADESAITATDYKAYYSLDAANGAYKEATVSVDSNDSTGKTGIFTINGLGDYTGIIQIKVVKGDYTAIMHVMVVGPVVHSGLAPAVFSA